MDFAFLGLSDKLLAAVADAGYSEPTPIQRQAIPTVLQGRDILGIAQTGTGKTASFTLPMIDILSMGRARARMPRSLILEPTRELAAQVAENFEKYGKNHKLAMALLIGGTSFADQEALLDRGVDVLIATPGRLIDHFERGKVLLNGVEILVVDEADRMLDMGFIPDVERICAMMPQKHQTLFFSATMPPPVKKLTDRFLDDPKLIQVARPATAAATVKQWKVAVAERRKREVLRAVLRRNNVTNAIVFCNRKRDVREVFDSLQRHGFAAVQLHGDMDQPSRMEMLARFKAGEAKFLVASDVAARGLDIPAVSHVVNFDVPHHPDDYVHRIGRTGRAGRSGESVSLVTPRDREYMDAIEKLTGQAVETLAIEGGAAADDEGKPARYKTRGKGKADGKPKEADRPKEKSGRKEDGKQQRPGKRGGRKAKPADGDAAPVGMGDHVPAFLARPTRKSKN
ncbi:MAG: DEAD/DEAH box helicase [Alphaproteobacteria bacterium]|nr:MAG: DEAD/DEAH box helicase [Alphaproteobacteria bacterium]